MQPSDIGALVGTSQPRVSPDGSLIAFVVNRADVEANRYRSQVWLAPADGSWAPQPLTAGEHGDANPCWSPDGRRLAFTSHRGTEPKTTSVHVLPVGTGGEAVTLAAGVEGISDLTWAPDGRRLAFSQRVRDARYEPDDDARRPPRRITRLFSRLDGEGFISDRPQHVHVVAADASAGPVDLTPGEFQHDTPDWSPDSRWLACSAARHENWDLDLCVDLYVVGLDGGPPRRVTDTTGIFLLPAWSPEGDRLAFCGVVDPFHDPQNFHLGVVEVATGAWRFLGRRLDRTTTPMPGSRPPIWLDGQTVLVAVEDRGNVHLYRYRTNDSGDGAVPELVLGGERTIAAYDAAGGTVAVCSTTNERPPELHVWRDGEERRLSTVTDAFVARTRPRPAERFLVASTGGAEVDAWLVTPPDFNDQQRHPCLLNIHGGPYTQYGNRFFDEAQLQAAAGYVVLMANPRGSSGREEAWGTAIAGAKHPVAAGTGWGSVDYEDLMAVVDTAIERYPFIDPDRLGVLGGSYGGYMTSWIVSHTDRFVAACSERAVNNFLSLEWTSDVATAFRGWVGVSHLDDPDEYLRCSPITYVRAIHTPMLIVHSEEDLRCPMEQADQLFVALRLLGREVEQVRFPGEGHELSRSGSPAHRIQRAEIILEWFDRHLKAGS